MVLSMERTASQPIPKARDPHADSRKPIFHVSPVSGWGSDPNGPIFYKGRYHLFYQSVDRTCQWYWGLSWDHVVSEDLAHWRRLPRALAPSPGGPDADGCFSGSIQVDQKTGVPILFYTGARLKHNKNVSIPLPPPELDMQMQHVETQCCAVCDPDDELMITWRKVPTPWMELPHTGALTAWRDPWFVNDDCNGDCDGDRMMIIGSGIRGQGGTALIYRSADLTKGWRYSGQVASWPNLETGICWECPFLIRPRKLPSVLEPLVPPCKHQLVENVAKAQAYKLQGGGESEEHDESEDQVSLLPGDALSGEVQKGRPVSRQASKRNSPRTSFEDMAFNKMIAQEGGSIPNLALDLSDLSMTDSGFQVEGNPATFHLTVSTVDNATNKDPDAMPDVTITVTTNPNDADALKALKRRDTSASGRMSGINTPLDTDRNDRTSGGGAGGGNRSQLTTPLPSGTLEAAVAAYADQVCDGSQENGVPTADAVISDVLDSAAALRHEDSYSLGTQTTTTTFVIPGSQALQIADASRPSSPTSGRIRISLDGNGPTFLSTSNGQLDLQKASSNSFDGKAASGGLLGAFSPRGLQPSAPQVTFSSLPSTNLDDANSVPQLVTTATGVQLRVDTTAHMQEDLEEVVRQLVAAHLARRQAVTKDVNGNNGAAGLCVTSAGAPGAAASHATPLCGYLPPDGEERPGSLQMQCSLTEGDRTGRRSNSLSGPQNSLSNGQQALGPLQPAPGSAEQTNTHDCQAYEDTWMFSCAPDACTYSILYWLGEYTRDNFHLPEARGPFKLDLGNVLYATTCMHDPKGRHIIYGWMKELRNVPPPPCLCNKYSYSGCVSLPRAAYLKNGKLFQAPLPELKALRQEVSLHDKNVKLSPEKRYNFTEISGLHLDIELTVRPGTATKTVLLLQSWRPHGAGAAAIVFDWPTLTLSVVFDAMQKRHEWQGPPSERGENGTLAARAMGMLSGAALLARRAVGNAGPTSSGPSGMLREASGSFGDLVKREMEDFSAEPDFGRDDSMASEVGGEPDYDVIRDPDFIPDADMNPAVADWIRMKRDEAGGVLDMQPGEPLQLRIFLDASAVEIFTGTGEALTTRVYRGHPPRGSTISGVDLLAVGGTFEVDIDAWEMGSCWPAEEDTPKM